MVFVAAIRRGHQSSTVPVVNVGTMRVGMRDGLVIVFVQVRLGDVDSRRVRVGMVEIVMSMWMCVHDRLVDVAVVVALREVQPHADRHQCARRNEPGADRFAEDHDRHPDADERTEREVRARSGGTERSKREASTSSPCRAPAA